MKQAGHVNRHVKNRHPFEWQREQLMKQVQLNQALSNLPHSQPQIVPLTGQPHDDHSSHPFAHAHTEAEQMQMQQMLNQFNAKQMQQMQQSMHMQHHQQMQLQPNMSNDALSMQLLTDNPVIGPLIASSKKGQGGQSTSHQLNHKLSISESQHDHSHAEHSGEEAEDEHEAQDDADHQDEHDAEAIHAADHSDESTHDKAAAADD